VRTAKRTLPPPQLYLSSEDGSLGGAGNGSEGFAARLAGARFAAGFFAAAFFAGLFFAAYFLVALFFVVAFLVAPFFVVAFFATTLRVAFFVTAFFAPLLAALFFAGFFAAAFAMVIGSSRVIRCCALAFRATVGRQLKYACFFQHQAPRVSLIACTTASLSNNRARERLAPRASASVGELRFSIETGRTRVRIQVGESQHAQGFLGVEGLFV
jgi:asparagine N-glycosylation enzyme membrane subunit Stt3